VLVRQSPFRRETTEETAELSGPGVAEQGAEVFADCAANATAKPNAKGMLNHRFCAIFIFRTTTPG
jgi:hypothetical protein